MRHSLDCSLIRIVRLPQQISVCIPGYHVNSVLECKVVYYRCLRGNEGKARAYLLQNTVIIAVLLIVFTSIYCPLVQFSKHAHTSVHTISFVAPLQYFLHPHLSSRGGVEDTRLKAKAKDTKKSEAKAKNRFSEDRFFRGQG